MPASTEMSNYYFHQISSFCCINVLCCINHWWHIPIAYDPVMTRSPHNLTLNDLTTLNLKLTEPYDENLIRKYVIEKCHIKYLPQSIYSLCMYLYPLHIQGKQ